MKPFYTFVALPGRPHDFKVHMFCETAGQIAIWRESPRQQIYLRYGFQYADPALWGARDQPADWRLIRCLIEGYPKDWHQQ